MIRIFSAVKCRIRSFLGLDWITEAREIAENARRNNVVEEQLRPRRKERDNHAR